MCEHVKIPGQDGTLIICGLRSSTKKCVHCGEYGQFLCDWKVQGKRSGTCDRALCAADALEVAPGKHLCREHQWAWRDWQKLHGAGAATRLVRTEPQQMSLL